MADAAPYDIDVMLGARDIHLFNFKASQFNMLRKKFASARAGGTLRPLIMTQGDSTTLGHSAGATAGADNLYNVGASLLRPSKRLAQILSANDLPAADNSHYGMNSFGAGYTAATAITAYDPDVVPTANWTSGNPGGVIGGSWWQTTSADAFVITPTVAWDRCEILWVNAGVTTVNVLIAGGAPASGGSSYSTVAGNTQGKAVFGSASPAVQALSIAKASGTTAYLNGVRFWNSTVPGVDVICNGGGGYTATNGAATGAYYNLDAIRLLAPDIGFVNYGTNDWNGNTQAAYDNYGTALTTIVTAYQSYYGQAILVAPPPLLSVTDAQTQNYLAKMRAVAIAKNCPMLSLYDRFERTTTNLSTDWYVGIHGNKEQYADIGAAYAEVIKLIVG